ncbi:hypothetical protein IFM89_007311 [Coptis chinensis]|uniref:Late embryogenesis abundant protein LEA-2 subgroup domain-containing protein n=1 Tax=Coptis chinensis TaxID=261450 RepID=A0A835LBA0_9MAGN|nr:hypothetical protein IFM89_007311 [Coptis chinensis]
MCETKSFYLWVAQVLFLSGLLALILWLSLHPKSPNYTVTDLNIPVNANQNENTTISVALEIQNPNKDYNIYYDDIYLALYHASDTIGGTTITAFRQYKKGSDHFYKSIVADGGLWNVVLREVLNGTAELKVGLFTKIRYRMWGRKSKHHGMHLNGRIPIGKDGKISRKKKIKLRKQRKKMRFVKGSI